MAFYFLFFSWEGEGKQGSEVQRSTAIQVTATQQRHFELDSFHYRQPLATTPDTNYMVNDRRMISIRHTQELIEESISTITFELK